MVFSYWTLFLISFAIIILCLYLILSQRFFTCKGHTLQHFIAICPVCEQLTVADSSVVFDKNVAIYWRDKPIVHFPDHPAIQKLRRKLFRIDGSGSRMSVAPILNELKNKPNDPTTNTKLLNSYVYNGRFLDAYDRAFKKRINFVPNLFWYESCVQVCQSYKNKFPNLLDEEFYGNYLTVLERTLALSVQDVKMPYKIIPEVVALLASFDELLFKATNLKNPSNQFLRFIGHMRGQLYFNTALILYRKAKQKDYNWSEMIKSIAPLLSYSTVKCFDLREVEREGKLSQILNICIPVTIYRIKQAGYILSTLAAISPEHFTGKIFNMSNNWKHRVCEILYNTSDYKNVLKASAFMEFNETLIVPEDFADLAENFFDDVDEFLSVSETVYPSSLHHLVWIGVQHLLRNKNSICDSVLPLNFSVKLTHSLQSLLNYSSSYAESLSKTDLEAFLFACVYCAKSSFDHQMDKDELVSLNILPADVSKLICLPKQDLWWDYVNQTVTKECDSHEVKSFIRQGIENIRLTEPQVLPLQLLVLLGRTFSNKAEVESNKARATELKYRARLYWEAALPLLENPLKKDSCLTSCEPMFVYHGNIMPVAATKLIFEGKRIIEMFKGKEKDGVDSVFLKESSEKPKTTTFSTLSQAGPSFYSSDDSSLEALLEQNAILMDRLEKLSNCQVQKADNVLIMHNNRDSDTLSTGEQPASLHTASQATNISVKNKSTSSVPVQPLIGNNFHPMPASVQTCCFPMSPSTPSSFSLTTLQNFQFIPGTKNSYSTTDRPIASSCLFNTTTSSDATPARYSSTIPSSMPLNETLEQSTSQKFGGSKLFQNTLSNSMNLSETPPTISITPSFSFSKNISFSQQVTSLPLSVAVAPTLPHSFQLPNEVNSSVLLPSVRIFEENEEKFDDDNVKHDLIPYVKPLIPLPDEVEVKTGEEGIKDILFENQAKLYRFVDKEWKERGVGPLKILKNMANGRVRILMRRAAVPKICANHFLKEDMNLTAKGELAWRYRAIDFANEETGAKEILCVRFQTPEIAKEFYRVFNENKLSVTKTTIVEKLPQQSPVASPLLKLSTPASTSSPLTAVGDVTEKIVIAPSFLNVRSPKEKSAESSKIQFRGFTFSAKPIFTTVPRKRPFASFSGFSLNTLSRSDGELKLFSSYAAPPSAPGFVKSEEKSSMLFGTAENVTDFSTLSNNVGGAASAKSNDFKGFAGASAPVSGMKSAQTKPAENMCNFLAIPKSSPRQTTSSPKTAESPQDENSDGKYVPTAEFTPVTLLPELKEVITDEEGLEVLYGEQCELFRFTDDQWKERGVGKMKILRDPKDGTIQLLMRSDQVHKVCCKQRLTTNHELKTLMPMDKAWSWVGKDFSEGELKDELLCMKFGTVEMVTAFKQAFDNAKARLPDLPAPSTTTAKASPSLSEKLNNFLSRWKCQKCLVANKKERTICVVCQQPKDGNTQPSSTSKSSVCVTSGGSFRFSSNSTVASTTSVVASSFDVPAAATTSVFNVSLPTLPTILNTSVSTTANSSESSASSAHIFSIANLSSQNSKSCNLRGNSNTSLNSINEFKTPPKSAANTLTSTGETKIETALVAATFFDGAASSSSVPIASTSNVFCFDKPIWWTIASTGVWTTANSSQSSATNVPISSIGNLSSRKSERRRFLIGNSSSSLSSRNESTLPSKNCDNAVKSAGEMKNKVDFGGVGITGDANSTAASSFGLPAATTKSAFSFSMPTSSAFSFSMPTSSAFSFSMPTSSAFSFSMPTSSAFSFSMPTSSSVASIGVSTAANSSRVTSQKFLKESLFSFGEKVGADVQKQRQRGKIDK